MPMAHHETRQENSFTFLMHTVMLYTYKYDNIWYHVTTIIYRNVPIISNTTSCNLVSLKHMLLITYYPCKSCLCCHLLSVLYIYIYRECVCVLQVYLVNYGCQQLLTQRQSINFKQVV